MFEKSPENVTRKFFSMGSPPSCLYSNISSSNAKIRFYVMLSVEMIHM